MKASYVRRHCCRHFAGKPAGGNRRVQIPFSPGFPQRYALVISALISGGLQTQRLELRGYLQRREFMPARPRRAPFQKVVRKECHERPKRFIRNRTWRLWPSCQ